ncbi:hypothetical protein [Methylomicrobium agile]|uniref:hypothetical protein n=1 Tax=Methylomicrobium agile TaxID=39774 RepID=UPI0012F6B501|nr:hypothetical protein [Methylomicrobium agile]
MAVGVAAVGIGAWGLINKMSDEIERISQRPSGPDTEQYSLRATYSGDYPNVRGGTVYLNAGDVWKYGQTSNPESRYSQKELAQAGLRYVTEFQGGQVQALIQEKLKIYSYVIDNGTLPPGNKIFR